MNDNAKQTLPLQTIENRLRIALDNPTLSLHSIQRLNDIGVVGELLLASVRPSNTDFPLETPTAETFVVKLSANAPIKRLLLNQYGMYDREWRFYQALGNTANDITPQYFGGWYEQSSGDLGLFLEYVPTSANIDIIHGLDVPLAERIVNTLPSMHAFLNGPRFGAEFLSSIQTTQNKMFETMFGLFEKARPKLLKQIERDAYPYHQLDYVRQVFDQFIDTKTPWITMMSHESYLIHGDLHANNVLVPTKTSMPIQFIDWQSVRLGSPAHDLSYLLISSMASEQRQQIETSMLTALATAPNQYLQAIDWQQQYAVGGLFNLLVLGAGFQLRQHKFTASPSLFALLERCLTFVQQHKPMNIG